MTAARRIAVALAVVGVLGPVAAAVADHVPGARYSGRVAGTAAITFTLSGDGSRVVSYRISDVRAGGCVFTAAGDADEWEGVPVSDHAFSYRLYDAIVLRGAFAVPQAASGTVQLRREATADRPACDSGALTWSATTPDAAPASGAPPSSSGPSGAPGGPSGAVTPARARARVRTSVLLRRRTRVIVSGRVRAAVTSCRRGRRVQLRRAIGTPRVIATTTTRADGTFRFRRIRALRTRPLRAHVGARVVGARVCGSARSRRIAR